MRHYKIEKRKILHLCKTTLFFSNALKETLAFQSKVKEFLNWIVHHND